MTARRVGLRLEQPHQAAHQLFETVGLENGRFDRGNARFLAEFPHILPGILQIHFGSHDDARPLQQSGIALPEFVEQRPVILHGAASLLPAHVDDEHEHLGALDMAHELVAEPGSLVGILDDAGNIRNPEARKLLGQHHRADDGPERREVIGRDFRVSGGDFAQQGGFSGTGEPDQPHIGQEGKIEPEAHILAGLAGGKFARRLMRGGFKMQITDAALSAFRREQLLSVMQNFAEFAARLFVLHACPERNGNLDVAPIRAMLIASAPGTAVGGAAFRRIVNGDERIDILITHQVNVTAPTPIAAVRTAFGLELFTPEGIGTIAAGTGDCVQDARINKGTGFHNALVRTKQKRGQDVRIREAATSCAPTKRAFATTVTKTRKDGGVNRSRTDLKGFAVLCLAAWLSRREPEVRQIIAEPLSPPQAKKAEPGCVIITVTEK